jgi:hypothetical protein
VLGEEPAIWDMTYGGTGNDDCFSVLKANDGGYILAGDTASFGAGETDVWLIKTDVNGNMEWNKTYGGAAADDVQFMIADDDGYILAGRTYSFGEGDADLWLIKTDFNGNMIWNRTYGGPQTEWCWSIVKTSDDGYALLGRTNSYGSGNNDFWLVKTDSEGLLDWNTTIGDTGDERGRFLVNTVDGGFLLLGWTNSSGAEGIDFWLVKTDSHGNPQWNKTYGGESGDRGKVIVKTENEYLLGGSTTSFGAGDNDIWLVRVDSTGNQIWNKTYGGQARETVNSMLMTDDGGYALAGYTYSFGAGDQDVWLVKTDSAGNVKWNQTYGGAAHEAAHTFLKTDEGGYLLAGFSASYGSGDTDVFLIKADAQGVIPEFPSWMIIPLFLITTLIVVLYRNRLREMVKFNPQNPTYRFLISRRRLNFKPKPKTQTNGDLKGN